MITVQGIGPSILTTKPTGKEIFEAGQRLRKMEPNDWSRLQADLSNLSLEAFNNFFDSLIQGKSRESYAVGLFLVAVQARGKTFKSAQRGPWLDSSLLIKMLNQAAAFGLGLELFSDKPFADLIDAVDHSRAKLNILEYENFDFSFCGSKDNIRRALTDHIARTRSRSDALPRADMLHANLAKLQMVEALQGLVIKYREAGEDYKIASLYGECLQPLTHEQLIEVFTPEYVAHRYIQDLSGRVANRRYEQRLELLQEVHPEIYAQVIEPAIQTTLNSHGFKLWYARMYGSNTTSPQEAGVLANLALTDDTIFKSVDEMGIADSYLRLAINAGQAEQVLSGLLDSEGLRKTIHGLALSNVAFTGPEEDDPVLPTKDTFYSFSRSKRLDFLIGSTAEMEPIRMAIVNACIAVDPVIIKEIAPDISQKSVRAIARWAPADATARLMDVFPECTTQFMTDVMEI
ncbi:hypothetical protein HNP46_004323 [Pseudomonas nitritireducens]|uniref:Uncharacterized protein n=1 Tax=Pseudomonas nitroreducens TaxID=46680 RepID=A0A7W7KMA6_PSENT|nr:hypothetical protein [Pseudomonas nitritireducens]MBB4865442.1 hypothetical protein [Pseudomonas nitritireducens]